MRLNYKFLQKFLKDYNKILKISYAIIYTQVVDEHDDVFEINYKVKFKKNRPVKDIVVLKTCHINKIDFYNKDGVMIFTSKHDKLVMSDYSLNINMTEFKIGFE